MSASDKHVLDLDGLEYFKTKLYTDLNTIFVTQNAAITGATKCKITYDSKGLVTAGADLAATDLPNNYGDGKNPYASKTANYVLAAPNGSAGTPSFRALVAADIPSLAISKITDLQTILDGKYVKPQGGIPANDLAETYLLASAKGASNGVASLDSNSKIPLSQIPEAILGASEQGGVITYSNNTMTISLNQNGAALLGTTAGNKTWSELAALLYAKQTEGTGLYFIFENDVASYDFAINSVSNVITDIQVGDWVIYNGGTDIRKIENVDAVKSVQILGTSPVLSSNATAQNGIVVTTISLADAYGDTKNPYGSKTANYILAAPNGSAGAPSFRALVSDDIPALAISKITDLQTTLNSKYVKPADGIPDSDLEQTYTKQSDFTVDGSTLILEWL